jgi:gamma-glutamyltranspeptidase/glutathione hydrolase
MRSPRRPRFTLLFVLGLAVLPASCGQGASPLATLAPDAGNRVVARHGVVASAHPLASEAGLQVLQQGGNAVDAAVAAAFAIGVVEPEMSGLGGSGAMLVFRSREAQAEYLDFYASQPIASFRATGVVGRDTTAPLRVVGVPGLVAGLLAAQERFGRLTRAQAMAPAIRIAEDGFPMYPVLKAMIDRDTADLARDPVAAALLLPGGRPLALGEHFANPALARTLRQIAEEGPSAFYAGQIARDVVARMNAGGHPVTLADFGRYQPTWKRPLCTTYNNRVLLSAAPPEGGMQMLATVKLLDPAKASAYGLPNRDARAFDLFASAMRVGQTTNRANFDPRWEPVPARGTISDGFAEVRRADVGTGHAADSVAAVDAARFDGNPSPAACGSLDPYGAAAPVAEGAERAEGAGRAGRAEWQADGETTHISVVDQDGNAVAVTVTNSSVFGSGAAVDGFFLNNSGANVTQALLDRPDAPAWLTRITTIAPTIVLRDGGVEMVVGSPGGGLIPLAIAQTIWYVLDYDLDPLEAVRMPRITPRADSPIVAVESGVDPAVLAGARAMGYRPVRPGFEYARVYAVVRRGGVWIGVADPRHDGQVRGY